MVTVKCRRCLQLLIDDNTDPEDDDTEAELGTPQATVHTIAAEYPTVLCLDCYDAAYAEFAQERIDFETLDAQVELLSGRLEISDLKSLVGELIQAAVGWNIKVAKWIAKGVEGYGK